jgi:hypothetical protein
VRVLLALVLIGALFVSGAVNADVRIRAGNALTDSTGTVWSADSTYVTGGQLYTDSGLVSGTSDPALYLSHRYGSLTYRIPASGQVNVVLHFAEVYFTQAGQRVFTATVEGTPYTLDILALAGPRSAYRLALSVTVSDGELTVILAPGAANNPMVSAIEVTGVEAPSTPSFSLALPPCQPWAAFEFKYRLGSPGAIVTWCDEPYGIRRYHLTWTDQNKGAQVSNTSEWRDAAKAVFTRVSTLKEHGVVSELSRRFAPKCYARTSGTATSVPVYGATSSWTRGPQRRDSKGLLMTLAPDQEVGCDARLLLSTRYCLAQGRPSTGGDAVPPESFALCAVRKAPQEGWESP